MGMPPMDINSDWMSNASSGLCIILGYISYTESSHFPHFFSVFPFSLFLFFTLCLFPPLLSLGPLSFLSSFLSLLLPLSHLSFLSFSSPFPALYFACYSSLPLLFLKFFALCSIFLFSISFLFVRLSLFFFHFCFSVLIVASYIPSFCYCYCSMWQEGS